MVTIILVEGDDNKTSEELSYYLQASSQMLGAETFFSFLVNALPLQLSIDDLIPTGL